MKSRRLFALLLALSMLVSLSVPAMAVETEEEVSTPTYPVAENVYGKTVTVDGLMGKEEGWSKTPMFQTTWMGKDIEHDDASHRTYGDQYPSDLYISTDGEKIYFFYEITHPDMVNSGWISYSGVNSGWVMPEFTLYFAPEGEHLEEQRPEDHCFRLNLRLFRENLMTGVTLIEEKKDYYKSYKWDGSLNSDSKWQQNDDNWEHIFGHMNYGSSHENPKNSTEAKQYGTYNGGYLEGTEIAVCRYGASVVRINIEIAVPLSEELTELLKTTATNYRVGAYERTYRYQGAEAAYGCYGLSPKLVCSAGENEAPYNENWMFTSNCGYTFTLPKISKTAPVLVGFQTRQNESREKAYDVRYVSVVKEYEGFTLQNSRLGYVLGYDGETREVQCTKLYTALKAGNKTIYPEEFGGKYFFCFTIKGLYPNEAGYTFDINCFTRATSSSPIESCTNPVTVKLSGIDKISVLEKGWSASNPWTYTTASNGVVVREITIDSGKGGDAVEIMHLTDLHFSSINDRDRTENNPLIMASSLRKDWFANNATLANAQRCLEMSKDADQIMLTGDLMCYLSWGNIETLKTYVWDRYDNVMGCVGNHDTSYVWSSQTDPADTFGERVERLESAWNGDIYYASKVIGEKVMVIQLNNALKYQYWDVQVEKFAADLATARANGYVVLLFYHVPMSTGFPFNVTVDCLSKTYGDSGTKEYNFYNWYVGEYSKGASKQIYDLITNNGDIIKGAFCGHAHNDFYTEIKAKTPSGEYTVIPQYTLVTLAYGQGHALRITVK